MMDTAKLLAELDASDRKINGHGIQSAADYAMVERNQQLREALARIAELEAVVVPLERLLRDLVAIVLTRGDDYCVALGRNDDYLGNTLSEALAAAVKSMEDGT